MEITKGYKQTEVGVIPEDWEVIKIEDCGKIITGGTPSTSKKEFWNGDIPWITPTDIKLNSRDIYYGERFLSENGIRVIREVPKNTLLVTCIASIGKNAILKTRGACNQQINAVTTNDKVKVEFLYYRLEQNKSLLIGKAGQTATPILSKKSFGEILITLPPLPEQTAIAEALSDMDALIAQTEKLIEKKKAIKQGMMQELLTPKEGWVTKKLGDVTEIIMGQSPLSVFYNIAGVGLPLVQGNADISDRKTIIRYYSSQITKRGKIGDFIMTVRAPVGEISKTDYECCLGRGVCAIRYDNDFIYHYLISIENYWKKLSAGSTFDSVNSAQIKDLLITIPKEKSEQQDIANILTDSDEDIEGCESKLQKLKLQKQGMMQTLLTGKIRLV